MIALVADLVAAVLHWLAHPKPDQRAADALADFEARKECLDAHDVCCPRHSPRRVDGALVAAAGKPAATPAVVPCPAVGAAPGGHFNLN